MLLWTRRYVYLSELEFLSFPDICSGVRLQNHTVALMFGFLGASIVFSLVAAPTWGKCLENSCRGRTDSLLPWMLQDAVVASSDGAMKMRILCIRPRSQEATAQSAWLSVWGSMFYKVIHPTQQGLVIFAQLMFQCFPTPCPPIQLSA